MIKKALFSSLFTCAITFALLLAQIGMVQAQDEGTEASSSSSSSEAPVLEVPEPFIADYNGNGQVKLDAFGDSITRGRGDFVPANADAETTSIPTGEAGYPLRIERMLSVPVSNLGIPGERLAIKGLPRFADTVPGNGADIVMIGGGTNDAIDSVDSERIFRSIQIMVNIAKAEGIRPMLITPPPACCDRTGFDPPLRDVAVTIRTVAQANDTPLADVQRAFLNTCPNLSSCRLLNRPEGLHPNTAGYNVIGEVVIATLLNIDIFDPNGPALLEQALAMPEGTVLTRPDPR